MLDKLMFGKPRRARPSPHCSWRATSWECQRPHLLCIDHKMVCDQPPACTTGLGGATLVCATLPFHAQTVGVLLSAVGLLGIFCGVAFGSSYQLVSRFSSRESVALTTGDSMVVSPVCSGGRACVHGLCI